MALKWYVVHTYSGCEGKVKVSLEEKVQSMDLQEKIKEILVPMEDVVEIRSGKKKISSRKFFPGYIMINMDMSDETWSIVKNTPKVTGFLGETNNPIPLSEEEVTKLVNQIEGSTGKPKPKYLFEPGEQVMVIDGPFVNFTGVVDEINPERGKVKVMVSIFGRATPLELDIPQIEKV